VLGIEYPLLEGGIPVGGTRPYPSVVQVEYVGERDVEIPPVDRADIGTRYDRRFVRLDDPFRQRLR